MANRRRDYKAIEPDIIQAYLEYRSVRIVAAQFNVSSFKVLQVLHDAGIPTPKHSVGRRALTDDQKHKSCRRCHSYSRYNSTEGYCLRHRRSAQAYDIMSCFN